MNLLSNISLGFKALALASLLFLGACDDIPTVTEAPAAPDAKTSNSEFMIVIGDVQQYTSSSSLLKYLRSSLNWTHHQLDDGINITSVVFPGDFTNHNLTREWERFQSTTSALSQRVPLITCTGNHDYTWTFDGTQNKIYDRQSTLFNDYAVFPSTQNLVIAQFEPGRMENVVIEHHIQGRRFDFLVLEYAPREEVIQWASEYVGSHPSIKYILLTHEYISETGQRFNDKYTCAFWHFDGTGNSYTLGEDIWKKLVYPNDNIAFVLCGHSGFFNRLVTPNCSGREVTQVEFNVQYETNGGDGWIMVWEFPLNGDEAQVRTFNTLTGKVHNLDGTSFSFTYK